MDRCHNQESCGQGIILPEDRDFERKLCSFGHQFQKKKYCLFDIFHFQVDAEDYILPKKKKN